MLKSVYTSSNKGRGSLGEIRWDKPKLRGEKKKEDGGFGTGRNLVNGKRKQT